MKYQVSFRPLTRENNLLVSYVKISPLLWLHNISRLSQEKNCFSEMVWYFIGVYIINRILDGRLEIRNFSSRVENISLVHCAHSWNIFQHSKRNFVSPRNHVISSIYCIHWLFTKISGDVTENFGRHNSGFGLHDFGEMIFGRLDQVFTVFQGSVTDVQPYWSCLRMLSGSK